MAEKSRIRGGVAVSVGVLMLTGTILATGASAQTAEDFIYARTVTNVRGNALDVTVRIDQYSKEPVYALASIECLPQGWVFDGTVHDTGPGIFLVPNRGAEGRLEFVWVDIPAFPVTFAYRVQTNGLPGAILGQALYRYLGAEQATLAELTSIPEPRAVKKVMSQRVEVSLAPLAGDGGARSFGDCPVHTADQNGDNQIPFSPDLSRVIQFYNSGAFHCQSGTEDGYAPGTGDESCDVHDSDYNPTDWAIDLNELLRLIQFYNSGAYHYAGETATEDSYAPGEAPEIPSEANTLSNSSIGLTCGVIETIAVNLEQEWQYFRLYVHDDEATSCFDFREISVTRESLGVSGGIHPHYYDITLWADNTHALDVPEPDSPPGTMDQNWSRFCSGMTSDKYIAVELDEESHGSTLTTRITCSDFPNESALTFTFISDSD